MGEDESRTLLFSAPNLLLVFFNACSSLIMISSNVGRSRGSCRQQSRSIFFMNRGIAGGTGNRFFSIPTAITICTGICLSFQGILPVKASQIITAKLYRSLSVSYHIMNISLFWKNVNYDRIYIYSLYMYVHIYN